MTEYTWCPGEDCPNRVKVWPPDNGINYCCLDCAQRHIAIIQHALGVEDVTVPKTRTHSGQCIARQQERRNEPVVTGREFKIMGRAPESGPSRK